MEEIKVGYFIRTNKGIIGKLKRIELDEIDKNLKWYVFDKKRPDMNIIDEIYINKPYITKYSKNKIDLIEVGDIVHIKDVLHEDITYIWSEDYLKALKEDLSNGIKLVEILTHEQFEQNCYKLN